MTHTEAPGLTMRWIPVTDENGRTRMEARWMTVDQTAAQHSQPSQPSQHSQAA